MIVTNPTVTLPILVKLEDDLYVLIEDHAMLSDKSENGIWVSSIKDGESSSFLTVYTGDEAYRELERLKELYGKN